MAGKTDPVDDSFIKRSIQIRNEYPYILKAGEYSTWLSTNSQYGPFQDLIIDPDHIYVSLTVLASSKRGNFKLSLSYSETDLSVPVKEDKDAGVKESKNGISSFIKADYMPILQHTTKGSAYKVKRFLMSTYLLGAYDNSLNDISSKLVKHDLFYFSLDRFISSNGFSKFELLYDKSNLGYQTVTLNKIEVHVEESEPLFIVFIGKDEIKYIFSMETFARYFIRDILNYYPRILNTNSKYEYLNNFGIESDKKIIALFGVTQSGKSSLARAWLQGQSDPTLVTKNSLYKYVNGVNLPVYYQIGEPERGNKWTRGIRQGNLMDWIDIFENILIRKGDFFIIDSLRTFGTLSDANLTSGGISAELVNLLTIWNILLPRLNKTIVLAYNPLSGEARIQKAALDFFLSSCDVVIAFDIVANTVRDTINDSYLVNTKTTQISRKAASSTSEMVTIRIDENDNYQILESVTTVTSRNKDGDRSNDLFQ